MVSHTTRLVCLSIFCLTKSGLCNCLPLISDPPLVDEIPSSDSSRLSPQVLMLYKMVLCMCVVAATAFQAPASKLGMSAVRATAAPATRFASAVVMDEVEDKVKGIIAEQLGVEAGSVKPDSSFTEDLGADSLDAVELIMAIEEAFDIEIPDEEAETMTTPKECVAAIKAKL